MTDRHDATHDARWSAGLAADTDLLGALRSAGLEDCQSCRRRAEVLLRAERRLARSARAQRRLQDVADAMPPSAGEARALAQLVESGAIHASRPARRRAPLLAIAATIAAAIVVLFAWFREQPGTDATLGSARRLEIVRPIGLVERHAPFEWVGELPRGGWFVVRVAGSRADGSELEFQSPHLVAPHFDPAATEVELWPRTVRWSVTAHDASGVRIQSASATATLRSP